MRHLGLSPATGDEEFLAQRKLLQTMSEGADEQDADLQNRLNEAGVSFAQGRKDYEALTAEIASLKARRSNIPSEQVTLRSALCAALALSESDVPFAGELLQVREDERDWEGAAERLLRTFGLSLLVPNDHYAEVAQWVDRTHLGGRIVYFRVRTPVRSDAAVLHRNSLARKLAVKPDSPFYAWLERELSQRFDFVCCDTQEQFWRETRAITRAGQIKAPGERHEKDDRHRLDDRRRYVLGWTNEAKIAALEAESRLRAAQLEDLGGRIGGLQSEQRALKSRLDALSKLHEYADFRELDWRSLAAQIERLQDEKRQLESASNVLVQLVEQLRQLTETLKQTEAQLIDHRDKLSKVDQKKFDAQDLRQQTQLLLDDPNHAAHAIRYESIEAMRTEALGDHQLSVESCDNREREMRDWLQARIDAEVKKAERLRDKIIDAMRAYCTAFPGREGQAEMDRRWSTKVTDVRNWFTFAASERWREDQTEHEHYSDSGGKSGGQKEKLAYTILAASLAYQFGLEWGAVRSRSFRFVVIDEAFGRGSDESAQYGLKLFQSLNLQLLIVTPLQKIHIIEPYVASVGFVQNEDGRDSRLRNLTIEEYRTEKARAIA